MSHGISQLKPECYKFWPIDQQCVCMALLETCYPGPFPGPQLLLDEGADRNAEKTTSVKSGQLAVKESSCWETGRCKRFEWPNTGRGGSKFSLASAILRVSCNDSRSSILKARIWTVITIETLRLGAWRRFIQGCRGLHFRGSDFTTRFEIVFVFLQSFEFQRW